MKLVHESQTSVYPLLGNPSISGKVTCNRLATIVEANNFALLIDLPQCLSWSAISNDQTCGSISEMHPN